MKVRCPGCKEFFEAANAASKKAVCPTCGGQVLLDAAEKMSETNPKRDLLNDLLAEIRKPEALQPMPVMAAAPAAVAGGTTAMPRAVKKLRTPRKPTAHFPRRAGKAYDKKTRSFRSPTMVVTLGILVLVIVGYLVVHFIFQGIRNQAANTALNRVNSQIGTIESLLESADTYRAEKNYKKAESTYYHAANITQPLLDRLRYSAADLKPGSLLDKVIAADATLSAYLARAKNGRNADEVKHGAEGKVNFDGEWMTPKDKEKMIEAKMKREGRQLYEGEWLTQNEINRRKGLVFFNGHWVTQAEYRRRLAQAPPNTTPRPAPQPTPQPAPTTNSRYSPEEKSWMLNDFETPTHNWTSVEWENANPCTLTRIADGDSGQLKIAIPRGNRDKSAIVRPLRLDFSNRSLLRMDITNNCGEPLKVAIALTTNSYYESRSYQPHLKVGLNKNVTFDLRARDFKCETSRWVPNASVARLQQVAYLYILFYNQSGEVILDNIQALGGE